MTSDLTRSVGGTSRVVWRWSSCFRKYITIQYVLIYFTVIFVATHFLPILEIGNFSIRMTSTYGYAYQKEEYTTGRTIYFDKIRRVMDTYDKEQNTKVSFLFPRVLTERMDEVAVNIGVSRSQLLRKSTKEYLHFLENQYQRNNTQMV